MDEIYAVAEYESPAAMEEFNGAFSESDKWTKDLSKGFPGLFASSVRYQRRVVEQTDSPVLILLKVRAANHFP